MRAALTLSAAAIALAGVTAATAADWQKPYNGKDLSGWHVESGKLESWKANGELLSCVTPDGGYLTLDREYGDFELQLEYRLPKEGNSGVGVHFPKGGWPSTDGIEIQLLDDEAERYKNLGAVHRNGSIYSFVAPKAKAGKPAGEWNQFYLRSHGPHLLIRINGTEVQNVNLDEQKTKGKGKLPLNERPRRGLVGLQSHGDPVDFRKLSIREL